MDQWRTPIFIPYIYILALFNQILNCRQITFPSVNQHLRIILSETLFGDGEDVKAMFMRGEAGPQGPQGEPGPQGPQGEQGPQGPRGWAASIPTNPSFANLNVTDTTTDQLTVTGSAAAGQLDVTGTASAAQMSATGTVSAAQVSATGDISANRFIGNGSTLSYVPATVESNLRMVRGVVRDDGTIYHGAGFTVSRTDVGRYRITFTPSFSSPPTPILTPFAMNGGRIPAVRYFDSNRIEVELRDASSNFVDDQFSFLCIGTR